LKNVIGFVRGILAVEEHVAKAAEIEVDDIAGVRSPPPSRAVMTVSKRFERGIELMRAVER